MRPTMKLSYGKNTEAGVCPETKKGPFDVNRRGLSK